ncbi:hypothetical protein [Sphingomonas lenta]|uniref:hypothetical protein n=1 Tax=Sphingomonas lenta TaxID=1141887 RepID=UPI00159627BB|nr:hypothetical protein [Sphingomonas lenta]
MDLNYLYHRHGVSLMRADAAACDGARVAHLGLAKGYALRIDAERERNARCAVVLAEA